MAQCWHRSKKESNTPLQGNSMSCFFFFKQICTEKKKIPASRSILYSHPVQYVGRDGSPQCERLGAAALCGGSHFCSQMTRAVEKA